MRWPGERLGAHVRQVLELLLAAPRRLAQPLAQPRQRVEHERRAGKEDERQFAVVGRSAGRRSRSGASDSRSRSPIVSDTVCWIWPTSFGDPGHQLTGRPAREEGRRLVQHVPEQFVPHVHHDALPDVGHQVGREVAAHALEQVARRRCTPRPAPGSVPLRSTSSTTCLMSVAGFRRCRPRTAASTRRPRRDGPGRGGRTEEAERVDSRVVPRLHAVAPS